MSAFQVNPAFQFVFLHLTNRCNLTCNHCYVSSSPNGEFGLRNDVVKGIIDVTSGLKGNPEFIVSGGEPLSRRDDCMAILEYASARVKTKLFTNGILITKDVAKELVRLKPEIRISLDGSTRETNDTVRGDGTFDKILAGIENLFSEGYPPGQLSLCATLSDFDNVQIEDFVSLAQSIGISKIRFNALCRRGRGENLAKRLYGEEMSDDILDSKQEFESIFSEGKKSSWTIGNLDNKASIFSTVNIYSDGSVYPYIPHNHLYPRAHEIRAGNVNTTSLDKILISDAMKESILKKFLAYSMSTRNFSRAYVAENDYGA